MSRDDRLIGHLREKNAELRFSRGLWRFVALVAVLAMLIVWGATT